MRLSTGMTINPAGRNFPITTTGAAETQKPAHITEQKKTPLSTAADHTNNCSIKKALEQDLYVDDKSSREAEIENQENIKQKNREMERTR